MFVEDDKCAVCGKPHRNFKSLAAFNPNEYSTELRPYVCSEKCYGRAGQTERYEIDWDDEPKHDADTIVITSYEMPDGRIVRPGDDDYDEVHWATWSHSLDRKINASTNARKAIESNYRAFYREYWDARAQKIREDQETAEREAAERQQEEQRIMDEMEQERARIQAAQKMALALPQDVRTEHTHVLGGSGTGKTHLLQHFILNDLAQKDPPGMLVIDPKGLMIKRLTRLDCFNPDNGRLHNRLVIIDATRKPYPALNLFKDTSKNQEQRDLLFSQAISTFRYIFSAGGFKFTAKQANCFGYCVALMFEMGGTLSDLQRLLRTDGDARVRDAIKRLPNAYRTFFESDFWTKSYASTREEITTRLNELAIIPSFVGMFDQPERYVDIFDCIQKRKIILINTGIERNRVTSQMIGRLFISMLINAAYIRATLPRSQWHPCFAYIDEFQEYIDDEKTPEMLRLLREYNIGVTIAHQNMYGAELSDALRVVISGNTRTKFAANPRGMDLPYMARDLGCDPELFAQHLKTKEHAAFIASSSGLFNAVPVHIPWGNVQKLPQMDDEQYAWMWGDKLEQVSADQSDGDFIPWPDEAVAAYHATNRAVLQNPVISTRAVPDKTVPKKRRW